MFPGSETESEVFTEKQWKTNSRFLHANAQSLESHSTSNTNPTVYYFCHNLPNTLSDIGVNAANTLIETYTLDGDDIITDEYPSLELGWDSIL